MPALMAEILLLGRHLRYFNPDIYKCLLVKGYYITNAEATLLNRIDESYSNTYGNHEFIAGKDCIVHLEDFLEFYKFLGVCYNKLKLNINDDETQFGYIKFESYVIPYFIKEGKKYLPVIFFDSLTNDLLSRVVELKNWDFAYLKFCYKIMGVLNELYNNSSSCDAIALDDLINYYPPDTIFQDFWPKKVSHDLHIINYSERQSEPYFWISDFLVSIIYFDLIY